MQITLARLEEAVTIKRRIETDENRLAELLGDNNTPTPAPRQQRRRTVAHAMRTPIKRKRKGGLTDAGRARLSASMKRRWAAKRKAGKGRK